MKKSVLLLALLFQAGLGIGAEFAPDSQFKELNNFSGGLYTAREAHKLPDGYSPDMANVLVDEEQGTISKWKGTEILGSTNNLTNGKFILPYDKGNGSIEFILSDGNKVISTVDFITYKMLRSGLNSALEPRGRQVANEIWITNGSDPVFTYNGTTITVLDGQTYTTTKTPNVPRGKYIEYYHNRVWIGNVPGNDSITYYSDVTSTDSRVLAASDYRAWPENNSIKVGEGDGTPITFMKVFKGQLFIGKTNSIHTVFGNTRYNYFPRPTSAKIGFLSAENVVEHDNLLYGQWFDGEYSFNGEVTNRVTDNITPNMRLVRADTTRVVSNTWDTKAEFERNATMSGTTVTASGFVTMITQPLEMNSIDRSTTPPGPLYFTLGETSTSTAWMRVTSTNTVPSNYVGTFRFYSGDAAFAPLIISGATGDGTNTGTYNARMKHLGTGEEVGFRSSDSLPPNSSGFRIIKTFFDDGLMFTGDELNTSSLAVKITYDTSTCPSPCRPFYVYVPTVTAQAQIQLMPSSNTQYVSEITTISAITNWGNFNSVNATNGGTLDFYIKTATSLVQIATQPYISITPGSIIGSSITQTFIQWASSLTATSTSSVPNIDSVEIQHIEGSGSNTRSFGTSWDGRLWVFFSTEATGNYPVIYKKARASNPVPDAWMPGNGIYIRGIASVNNVLYGGAASSGTFYRLDYGTNYSGQPIEAYYDTPEFTFDNNYFEKTLLEYFVDTEGQSGNTLIVGTSVDGRANTEDSLDLTGTGRIKKRVYNVDRYGKSFRFRFKNAQVDKDLLIHNMLFTFMPYAVK